MVRGRVRRPGATQRGPPPGRRAARRGGPSGPTVQLLRRGGVRDRYRDEFVAELYGMTPRRRLRHVAGIAAAMPALSTVVRRTARRSWEDLVGPRARRPLRCATNMKHRWGSFSTEDGSRYRACVLCSQGLPGPGRLGRRPQPDPGHVVRHVVVPLTTRAPGRLRHPACTPEDPVAGPCGRARRVPEHLVRGGCQPAAAASTFSTWCCGIGACRTYARVKAPVPCARLRRSIAYRVSSIAGHLGRDLGAARCRPTSCR